MTIVSEIYNHIYLNFIPQETFHSSSCLDTLQREATSRTPSQLVIKTSNVKGAGTDSQLHVNFLCERGPTGWHRIPSQVASFEQGATDCCALRLPYMGHVTGLQLRSDGGGGARAAWHVDVLTIKVAVRPVLAGTLKLKAVAGEKWE